MKSLKFKENVQYSIVGIALLMPFLPIRQGGVLGLQHPQQSHIKSQRLQRDSMMSGSRDVSLVILLHSAQINRSKGFGLVSDVLSWHK